MNESYSVVPTEKTTSRKKRRRVVCLVLSLVCLVSLSCFGCSALAQSADGNVSTILKGQRENSVLTEESVDTGSLMTVSEVYAAYVNSTVGITTSITTNYFGYQTTAAAAGSGFIITEDGYILTNYHVVEDSDSDAITVALYNDETYEAELIGYDESNDIAVLKIDADGLTPVVIGDSGNMNVGDTVIAIGNPLGELTFSLTTGVISALGRSVTLSTGTTMTLIQTDCAINSGNSGGALFNLYGEVIGITNAKYSGSGSSTEASIDNIGFAIPINSVYGIVTSIIENGYIAKPYIGVSVSDVGSEALSYGLPEGASVKAVTEGGPAEKAGLEVNDIITAANGEPITGSSDLVAVVTACEVGDKLELTVYRQGETKNITVTVEEQVQSALGEEEENNTAAQGGYNSYSGNDYSDGYGYYGSEGDSDFDIFDFFNYFSPFGY